MDITIPDFTVYITNIQRENCMLLACKQICRPKEDPNGSTVSYSPLILDKLPKTYSREKTEYSNNGS